VITKLSFDELLVWVLDHETGAPVSGVEVRADGPGAAGATVRTDADGVATLPVPRPSEVSQNETREYSVTVAGRAGVAYTAWMQGAEPWLLGVPQTYWDQGMVAHVYTD